MKDVGAYGGLHLVNPNVTGSGIAAASTLPIAAQLAMDPDAPAKPATTAFGSVGFGFSSQIVQSILVSQRQTTHNRVTIRRNHYICSFKTCNVQVDCLGAH